jgi:hypothetical protein
VTANDGSIEWVLPEDADQFKREGSKMLPGKRAPKSGPIGHTEQPPAAQQTDPVPRKSNTENRALQLQHDLNRSNTGKVQLQVVATFLEKQCELSSSQSQAYAEVLVESGYDTDKRMQSLLLPTAVWPSVIKPGHKVDIVNALQAAQMAQEKAEAEMVAVLPSRGRCCTLS